MTESRDPFWSVVESWGLESLPVLPEWIEERIEEKKESVPINLPRRLAALKTEVGKCRKCELGASRKNPVFGEGNPEAGILVIGEGPGAMEDETGRPFVGRSGKLLDKIFDSIGLTREDLFIANIVKCRPPGNRTPTSREAAVCGKYLQQQIDIMGPEVIVTLGASAARYILDTSMGIGALRGEFRRFGDIPVLVTYHPAALLRSPGLKRPVWEDMKMLRAFLEKASLPRGRNVPE